MRWTTPAAVSLATLALAAPAGAATVTVNGDAGTPLPLTPGTPVTLRNMDLKATVTFAPAEAENYMQVTAVDPAGASATTSSGCLKAKFLTELTRSIAYHGNGTYTVIVRTYGTSGATNANCTAVPVLEQTYPVVIGASVAVTPPAGAFLLRQPGSFTRIQPVLTVSLNPGAVTNEVVFAKNGKVGPDGAIIGTTQAASLNAATGQATFFVNQSGTYTVVARATANGFSTPWSTPVSMVVRAPFDLDTLTFPDSTGPTYELRGVIRERAPGRVSLSVARGTKGGKYRSIGSAKITRGVFRKRFSGVSAGTYRLRVTYRGSKYVVGGRVTTRFRITRRVFFR